MGVTLDLVAGPDAGRSASLAIGRRSILGRSGDCGLRIVDAAVEAHHGMIRIEPDGAVSVVQLAGRSPIVVDGQPLACGTGWTRVERWIEVGDSLLARRTAAPVAHATAAGIARRAVVHRPDDPASVAAAVRDAARTEPVDPPTVPVVLGVGAVPDRLELVDHRGLPLDPATLPLDVQVAAERAAQPGLRHVVVDLAASAGGIVAIATDHRRPGARDVAAAIARGILAQLDALRDRGVDVCVTSLLDHRWGRPVAIDARAAHVVVVADRAEAVPLLAAPDAPASTTLVLLADVASPALAGCTAVLSVGARWRARWTPDTGCPTESYRLHAGGLRDRAPARGAAA